MISKIKKYLESYLNREEENDIDYNILIEFQKKGAVVLDVRSKQEYEEGYIEGSINIPYYELKKRAEREIKDKKQIIIIYCQTGGRSKKAYKILQQLGYKNIYNLRGGLDKI